MPFHIKLLLLSGPNLNLYLPNILLTKPPSNPSRALQFPPEGWLRIALNHGSITWVSIMPSGNVVLRGLSETGYMDPEYVTHR